MTCNSLCKNIEVKSLFGMIKTVLLSYEVEVACIVRTVDNGVQAFTI